MARSATIWLLAALALACAETLPPAPPPVLTAEFSGAQAFQHLAELVAIGPRIPESEGSERARAYLRGQLEALGLEVTEQTEEFFSRDEKRLGEVTNLVAVIPGSSTDLVVLAAPYDSQDLGDVRFVGANDGASGAALLLELARVFVADPLPYTTWLAFLGREAPHEPGLADEVGFIGSRLLVEELQEAERLTDVRAAVYFNQVADRELSIARDLRSHRRYRDSFFDAARRLGYADAFPASAAFSTPAGGHLAFWQAGVRRSLVVTDDRFGGDEAPGSWSHTEQDDLEHCSADSLAAVGRTSEAALRNITGTLAKIDRFTRRPEPSEPLLEPPAEEGSDQDADSATEPAEEAEAGAGETGGAGAAEAAGDEARADADAAAAEVPEAVPAVEAAPAAGAASELPVEGSSAADDE